jgi:oxaloacetate decarboxylase alpha subunit
MLSNLESQLREQNALGKLDAVLDEVAVVQRDFGYPPLVTPTSQIVGSQALFNVLFGRYERLTGESRDLLVGRYGRTPAEPDPALVRKALDELKMDVPITHRPADDIPNELHKIEEDLKAKLHVPHVPVEDVLTYAMFPQVALPFFAKRHKGPVTFDAPPASSQAPAPASAPAPAKPSGRYVVTVNGHDYAVQRLPDREGHGAIAVNGVNYAIAVRDDTGSKETPAPAAGAKAEPVVAPMPGDVIKLLHEDGDRVEAGATVLVMEAMKMQLEVKTRQAGVITYKVDAGSTVKAEEVLAVVG